MVLLPLVLATPAIRAGMTTPEQSWHGQLKDLTLAKAAPDGGVIGTKEDFAKLWKAWMGKEKMPEIDFEKAIVVVLTDQKLTFPFTMVVLDVEKGHARPHFAAARRANEKPEKRENKGFAFAIGVFKREGITTVNGKKLPGPVVVDNLRREIEELQARVEELERKLSEPELKKLQGTWKVSQFVADGDAKPAESREKMQGVIRDNALTLKSENIAKEVMRISVDPTAKPAAIDLAPDSEKGVRFKGIYELDKDTLKICFTVEGTERPKAFSSKKDEFTVLIILQRAQK
jgi:uncharacterized protein (TIGR03067 family)